MTDCKIISGEVGVSRQFLAQVVSRDSIEKALFRQTIVSLDRGWYAWRTLPAAWQDQVRHLTGIDPVAEANLLARTERVMALLEPLPAADRDALHAYRVMREEVDVETGEVVSVALACLSEADQVAYTEAAVWLRLLMKLDKRMLRALDMGRTRKTFIETVYVPLVRDRNLRLPLSYPRLITKEKEYRREGILCLISGRHGLANAAKVGDEQLNWMIRHFAQPTKPTAHEVWMRFNEEAMARGWQPINSVRTMQRHLERPEVAPLVAMSRDGYDAWKNKYQYQLATQRPSARNLLWVSDGTKVNYYYRDGRGIAARLNVYAVLDAYSGFFLGWAFREGSENTHLVRDAYRDAVRTAGGEMPYQALYDGDAANKAFFGRGWGQVHFNAMPHNGQSKPIEHIFGQLQQYIMRRQPYFTGQNVKAKSVRSQVNLDEIERLARSGGLPTREEAIKQAELDFHTWNNEPKRWLDGQTPARAWAESECPASRFLTPVQERDLFWEWNEHARTGKALENTYYNVGLQMEHTFPSGTRRKLEYEVVDENGRPDVDFLQRYTGATFCLKYDPENPEARVALYQGEDLRYVCDAVAKDRMPRAIYDFEAGTRGKIDDRLLAKRQQADDVAARLDAINALGADDTYGLSYRAGGKEVQEKAESAYLEQQARRGKALPQPEEVYEPETDGADLLALKLKKYMGRTYDNDDDE